MKKTNFMSLISTAVFCFICWMLFIYPAFNAQELLVGALVSVLVALFTSRFFIHEKALYFFNPVKLFNLIYYSIVIFVKELFKANIDVAKRALSPNLPINPGIVKIPVNMKSEYGLALLANSITLTPGTITMDITEEEGNLYYYIHWIDVATTDSVEAGEAIKGTLEKWIRRVFD